LVHGQKKRNVGLKIHRKGESVQEKYREEKTAKKGRKQNKKQGMVKSAISHIFAKVCPVVSGDREHASAERLKRALKKESKEEIQGGDEPNWGEKKDGYEPEHPSPFEGTCWKKKKMEGTRKAYELSKSIDANSKPRQAHRGKRVEKGNEKKQKRLA